MFKGLNLTKKRKAGDVNIKVYVKKTEMLVIDHIPLLWKCFINCDISYKIEISQQIDPLTLNTIKAVP